MKFLVVAPRFHTNLYYRVIALQNAGHSVRVAVLYRGISEYNKDIDVQQVKLSLFSKILIKAIGVFKRTGLKSGLELRLQSPGRGLKKIMQSYSPDVILLKAYQNALAIKTLLWAKKHKTKVLMLTQTTYTHIKGSVLLFKLNIRLFNFLRVVAYLTPIESNFTAFKEFGIKNVFYVPFVYPFDINLVGKETSSPLKIISVGKYVVRKDQLLLIEASKNLVENGKIIVDFYGEIADKQYYKELQTLINQYELKGKINLHQNIAYPQLQETYKKYDIFVLPSYSEPAAYSIVEAMANGLPVICSNQNGTACYIQKGINGFVFEAKNKYDLENKLKEQIDLIVEDKTNNERVYQLAQSHDLVSFSTAIEAILDKEH